MTLLNYRLIFAASLLFSNQLAHSQSQSIGTSLHQKYELAIEDIPAEALQVIAKSHPGVKVTGAEKELKNGNTYIDVEALDDAGKEIEFDMLLEDKGWRIAEIQRDLKFSDVPESVQNEFSSQLPNAKASRIIESDQDNGIVVYEFFVVSESGKETKYEIKFADGAAKLLSKEWEH